jgi:hypothetical protein
MRIELNRLYLIILCEISILFKEPYGGITPFSNEERGGEEITPLFHEYSKN